MSVRKFRLRTRLRSDSENDGCDAVHEDRLRGAQGSGQSGGDEGELRGVARGIGDPAAVEPSGSSSTVLRVPDMRGRGAAVGMMATFPLLANGTTTGGAPLTKLNRFSYVADVLVPAASFTGLPTYLDLFQPRGNADGSLFVRKPSQEFGAATAYGGPFLPDTWYRIAMVMQLDAATSAPRFDTYLNGQPVGQIVWDQIVVDSNRNAQLKDFDLVPDGLWSIAALSETQSSLPANLAGFFAFNDDNGEVGELYVASMQFRDDALSAAEVAALGTAAPGPIPVPEPGSLACVAMGAACGAARFRRRRQLFRPNAGALKSPHPWSDPMNSVRGCGGLRCRATLHVRSVCGCTLRFRSRCSSPTSSTATRIGNARLKGSSATSASRSSSCSTATSPI